MKPTDRRSYLKILALSAVSAFHTSTFANPSSKEIVRELRELEKRHNGRLGLVALDQTTGQRIVYRAQEAFPFCSTFKVLVASAALKLSESDPKFLEERIAIKPDDILSYSSQTEKNVNSSMAIADLCAATLQHSDNAAANLLMKRLGGLDAINRWAHQLGDSSFHLDRWETDLNSAIPGDPRDTVTPLGMAQSLQKLCLGDVLHTETRALLNQWMLGNQTGATRIRAGVPSDWKVADKTGSGAYGTTNDIGVVWTAQDRPIVLAIYFTQKSRSADPKSEVIAAATRLVIQHWHLP